MARSISILGHGTGKVLRLSFQTHEKNQLTVLSFFLFNPQPLVCWTVSEKQWARSTAALILPSHISVRDYTRALAYSSPCCMLVLKPPALRSPPHHCISRSFPGYCSSSEDTVVPQIFVLLFIPAAHMRFVLEKHAAELDILTLQNRLHLD